MKNENNNEINIKGIDKAKCGKSDESCTVEFGTVRIIQQTRQISVQVFLLILKIIILTSFLHILKQSSHNSPFTPGINSNNGIHKVRYRKLRLLNENKCTNSTVQYKSALLMIKGKNVKSQCSDERTETSKSSFSCYRDSDDEFDGVDLSDEGVLLGEMNKIILQEKLMREEFSKLSNPLQDEYFSLYFNDENCINRIMDLSRKSNMYRSKLLRLKYRIRRYIHKFKSKVKIFFMRNYKYKRNILEEFRASNFYYYLCSYLKCPFRIFLSQFSKLNSHIKSKY
ncbi:tryptophan-rich antigen, putative [Plasmodium knowlesi strain H]|uniref:Tryptophan-rich antigen, putative n=3 Tax=Plasmodium knowlesi TaxID=5850 RepID=A0A1A7VNB6_PLAKH|nr:Plasmodium exported protein, unknown function [Plasmodium knowlesi strain H]OTN67547.1 putative Tryptophan-rich antigen [Plasmodium knowlesi]CAA9987295.1 Plasmodium exported protein, unknown function [Plasmodium knowlesi strain H]SBO23431.1 tryptophan-rich antigen, putative [Plasmodium knowlesi strain H]SBO24731.1 tryptophan-rich antigen, putative [Plasmodium knowlesi strain H]VVS76769.1 Plasmodium exported protein, unknown function [Plasmodium knowlesi strain H]